MIPDEFEKELRTLVNKSVWLLKLMKCTPQSDKAYRGFFSRFRDVVVEASHKIDAAAHFVPPEEHRALLDRLDCTWDEKRRRLRLPDVQSEAPKP